MTQNITVQLRSDIVYVTGTVNSVPVTWTKKNANDWTAEAKRSDDNVYLVEITAVNSAGTSNDIYITLNLGLSLITDRTKEDVEEIVEFTKRGWTNLTADEKKKWLDGMKGSYNYTDLNRVGNAVKYIADMLNTAGYNVKINVKLDWVLEDLPTISQLEEYLGNVRTVRDATDVKTVLPTLPENMKHLKYNEANDIEQVLILLEKYLFELIKAQLYSNEVYSGEV